MNDFLHAFPGQETYEPVYVFARPYPISFLATTLVFLLVFLFTLIGQIGLANNVFGAMTADQTNLGVLFIGIFQLFIITIFLAAVFDFYYDITIVTDRRLVFINQEMMFYRKISELALEDVEDVTSTIDGLLSTVFEYGQVEVQTAGTQDNFIIENLHFPREVAAIALDLATQARSGVPEGERIPETSAIAVIDSRKLTTTAELQAVGAMLPDDFRRVPRSNEPQPVPVQPAA